MRNEIVNKELEKLLRAIALIARSGARMLDRVEPDDQEEVTDASVLCIQAFERIAYLSEKVPS